jgi:TnpA family transposase
VNLNLIGEQWDDLLRLAGSLKLGVAQASASSQGSKSKITKDYLDDSAVQASRRAMERAIGCPVACS